MTRHAEHAGTCVRCDGPIRVGQSIAPASGGWIHIDCGRGE